MAALGDIDPTFDVRSDAGGRDPDRHSKTLRQYHQKLWSKSLPNGTIFVLDESLHHKSDLGSFQLASDAITHTYVNWKRPPRLIESLSEIPPAETTAFYDLACTIGGFTLFPTSRTVNGKRRMSINQARGVHPRIRDRFDLTLECIRRHYDGGSSPLSETLSTYTDFFKLFESFPGYVDYFLLSDLVSHDYQSIRFLGRFDNFGSDPLPASTANEYRDYMDRSMDFLASRNKRIARAAFIETSP